MDTIHQDLGTPSFGLVSKVKEFYNAKSKLTIGSILFVLGLMIGYFMGGGSQEKPIAKASTSMSAPAASKAKVSKAAAAKKSTSKKTGSKKASRR